MSEPASHSRLVPLIVASALFMELLDGTIIVVALPAMAESFATDPVLLTIGITSYLLTLAVVIPTSGWLADRFGVRTVFASAILGFTLASLLCGISEDLWQFTAARILQGACAALMSPVGRLAVLRATPKKDLIKAIALITWPALIAPVLGPPLGGFIASTWSWRLIFFVNLPIGLIGMILVLIYIPNHRSKSRRPFDLVGFVLTALALVSLIAAIELLAHGGAGWRTIAFLFASGIVIGVWAIRHIGARTDRLVDLSVLRVKTFAATTLYGGILSRLTGGTMLYLLPLFFQIGIGLNAFAAGLMVLAYAFGNIAMKVVTTPILRRFGFRRVLVVNGLLTGLSILTCAALSPGTPLVIAVGLLFAAGCFRSMQFTCLHTLTFADIPDGQRSSATTLSSMANQLSIGLGIAIAAMVLNLNSSIRDGAAKLLGAVDFRIAFAVIALAAFLSILRFLALEPKAGAEVSRHRR
jgi:EmrB/QacA subfamily drug resistance transporter